MAVEESLRLPGGARQGIAPWAGPVLLLVLVLGLVVIFREAVTNMVAFWETPEYSHGWLIPFIALYLAAVRIGALAATPPAASWAGVGLLAMALVVALFGELSAIYVVVQYALILAITALTLTLYGVRGVKALWPPLVFLLFMVRLPSVIEFNLTDQLQLISSSMGGAMLRATGIPVFLEGNVIDLGNYKLQVVEACAGLRYLFPLMSFGMLCAVLFKGPVWQRILLFVSTAPIAIVMNSFRIAVTGLLVNRFGTEAAEGFLHYFEGWVVFTLCLMILFAEMWLLARLSRRSLDDVFDLQLPDKAALDGAKLALAFTPPLVGATVLVVLGALLSSGISEREELVPEHGRLSTFPLVLGEWSGQEKSIASEQLAELKLTDYLMADYAQPGDAQAIELYVAWYDSQRKGASIHSPKACLPGGGWRVEELDQRNIPGVGPNDSLPVNRAVVSMGEQRLLVYYWFMQRGRYLTNEYAAKWYIFWDSITKRRTDGALVRLVTLVPDRAEIEAADERMAGFARLMEPRLQYYIPGDQPVARAPAGPALEGR